MHMVGHQHIGMNKTAMLEGRITQVLQVAAIVLFLKKTWLPVIATLYDMLRKAGYIEARLARHGLSS
jgi:hypothetical protein